MIIQYLLIINNQIMIGVLQLHKWENAMTIDKSSWGFRRNANIEDYHNAYDLLVILAQTISCGGTYL